MKRNMKNFLTALVFVCVAITALGGKPTRAEAKVKDGTYSFSSCMVTKFLIKNRTLTLKVAKGGDSEGITKEGDSGFKKYSMKLKVAKNCKYREEYVEKDNGRVTFDGKKSSYKGVKRAIMSDRDFYKDYGYVNNIAGVSMVVKKGKVVKIEYTFMD